MVVDKTTPSVKLTQYSHGAGCGCKIAPSVLDKILKPGVQREGFSNLLVGNQERDDAAVFDQGDGTAIISTTDFFMPIVDDPKDFGRIASVNAISDIYAMGGQPMMAIAILGWPIDKLSPDIANQVVEGSREACAEAGIPLAGGHSIDCPEPVFGLAVTGSVRTDYLKKNGGATVGAKLFLTKPLGVGILSTAQKKSKLKSEHRTMARDSMVALNSIGVQFGKQSFVQAMTDVTGFGLLGHLNEMCIASNTSAVINYENIPWLDKEALTEYINEGCIPGGTKRNWNSYGKYVGDITEMQKAILCDPQTSGGLLVAIEPEFGETFSSMMKRIGYQMECIGEMREPLGNLNITIE